MRTVKIITFYFISFIGVALFLQGCKSESLYIEPEHAHPNFDLKKIGYSTFVNDPSINTALKPYLKEISENPLAKDNNQFLLLSLDQITKITTSQNETYTFEILNPLLNGSTYENLLIKKTGNELSFTYVQYICYDDHFENFDVFYFPVNISSIDLENEIFGKGVNKLMKAGLTDAISEGSTSSSSGGGSGCARYIYEACYLPNGMRGGCDGHAPACQHPNLTTEEREEHNRNGCNYQCSGSAIIAIDLTGCVEGSSSGSDDSYGSNGNPLDETNQSSNTGGGGSGNTNTSSVDGTATDYTLTSPNYGGGGTTVSIELINMLDLDDLTPEDVDWINNSENNQSVNQLIGFLMENESSPEAVAFVMQAISSEDSQLINEMFVWINENENSQESIIASTLTLTAINNNILENGYSPELSNILNQNANVDFVDPTYFVYFSIQCAIINAQHPSWPNYRVYWEASKEMVHLALDIGGLVPVAGEVCDLTNGLIYAIEGDGVNASLSTASAIPFVGWFTTGAKFAFKGPLKYVVKANGIIDFGKRTQLRKILGLTVGNLDQAHHIMPWTDIIKNHSVIQKAAKSAGEFHMNEALNGIAVAAWRNQPNHNVYTNLIKSKLDEFNTLYPNATPQQCYDFVSNLIQQIRDWVVSHPNSHLNDLVLP